MGQYFVGLLVAYTRALTGNSEKAAQQFLDSRAGFLEVSQFRKMLNVFLGKAVQGHFSNVVPERMIEWQEESKNLYTFLEKHQQDFILKALHVAGSLKNLAQAASKELLHSFDEELFDIRVLRGFTYEIRGGGDGDSESVLFHLALTEYTGKTAREAELMLGGIQDRLTQFYWCPTDVCTVTCQSTDFTAFQYVCRFLCVLCRVQLFFLCVVCLVLNDKLYLCRVPFFFEV